MGERLVKEHAGLKCSVTSSVKSTFGSKDQLPMTRMGAFHLFKETLRAARAEEAEKRTTKQKAIIEVFDELKMPVFCAAQSKGEIDGLLHMMKDEKVQMYIVDAFDFAGSVEELKKQNVGLVIGNVNNCSQIAKYGMDLSKVVDLVENGNLIAFTNTNGGYSEGREVFLWTAIELYRAGVAAEDIVKMMCLHPAQMLGIEDRVGTLEEGKEADLSVFTGHPVTTYAASVAHSMVNGEVLF